MAEVRLRFGRGASNFAQKICHRQLLESESKLGKGAIRASSLSAGFLLDGTGNRDLCGAQSAADRVTVGASRDSYTRVTPLFGNLNHAFENQNVAEYGLNKDNSLSNKPRVQNIENMLPQYRTNATLRRVFCTFRSARRQQSLGLFWGHGQFVRAYSGNGTRAEPLYKSKTGYYEILEVVPTATQAQIKTAYYKQSFIYHPDRNSGSEDATVRFSEISEAYTVLGNKALRKKYDRGLLSQSDLITTARPSAKDLGSPAKQQAESRRSVMGTDGRGGVFDVDKFLKTHYTEQLQKQRDITARKEEMLKKKQKRFEEREMGKLTEAGVWLLLAMAVGIVLSLKRG